MSGIDPILKDAQYWMSFNIRTMSCVGCCRHGPCMCDVVRHRDKNALIDERLTSKGYIGVVVCEPIGKDDHMACVPYTGDPNKLLPTTIAQLKDMLSTINAGHIRRDEPIEVWFDANDNLI